MAVNGADERPLEKLVEKEAAIANEIDQADGNGNTDEAIASLREQMNELRASISAIASTLSTRAEEARDEVVEGGRAALDRVASTAKSAAQTVNSSVKHVGHEALEHATSAADAVTEGKEKAKEIKGFETMQTVATLAPIAATVARRVPGGKKMVVAGATAYAAYLLLDAISSARDEKSNNKSKEDANAG